MRVTWRKSSFSGDGGFGGGNCVEAACLNTGYLLRDSKAPEAGQLSLSASAMAELVRSISR
ncbi:DUF397 domain-containing protein [Actinokineospora enzanensis]|uniref:DUF397 domain-containing protein n=1 Tax=Actinokineospora enzanensis TaxID=155975 RepID=UPI000A032271|nr:DUF397 domain-containing protein [Actinokineospora enzanensis]